MKQILLVEDDPFLIDIYATKLKESDFEVAVASDGQSALQKLKEEKFDLLILDIVLPKSDGWDVLKKIKDDPKLKTIPVVVFSNLGQKDEIEKGLGLGAVKYLIKAHYTPSEVVAEIKKIIKPR